MTNTENSLDKLSHDLIGELAIIRQKNNIVTSMLPALLKGYQLAIEHQLMDATIKEKHLKIIKDLTSEPNIISMIAQIHSIHTHL